MATVVKQRPFFFVSGRYGCLKNNTAGFLPRDPAVYKLCFHSFPNKYIFDVFSGTKIILLFSIQL